MLLSQPHHPHEERSWPVVLFRFKESTGWEQEVGGEKDGIATMVSPRKDRYGICRHDISLFWRASHVLTLSSSKYYPTCVLVLSFIPCNKSFPLLAQKNVGWMWAGRTTTTKRRLLSVGIDAFCCCPNLAFKSWSYASSLSRIVWTSQIDSSSSILPRSY